MFSAPEGEMKNRKDGWGTGWCYLSVLFIFVSQSRFSFILFFFWFDCLHHFKKFSNGNASKTWRIHKIYFIKQSHSFTKTERKKVVCFSLDFDWSGYSLEGATTKYVWLQWIWMENWLSVFGSNAHSPFGEFYANDM